jgi:hypothetical protein
MELIILIKHRASQKIRVKVKNNNKINNNNKFDLVVKRKKQTMPLKIKNIQMDKFY